MGRSRLVFFGLISMYCTSYTMQEGISSTRMPIIFDATALIKQNVGSWWRKDSRARSCVMAERLGGWIALIPKVFKAFGIPPVQERTGRLKFFAFLNPIPVPVACPQVIFEGDQLPPIMAAWALGMISNEETTHIVNDYIDAQHYSADAKEFYHALVYVTFDPAVMEQTTYLDMDALEIVEKFKTREHPLYLIGHCDRGSYARLHKKWEHLMGTFNRILFSHQIPDITPETQLDDTFWLHHLGISDQQDYVVVDDWKGPGVRGDAPPHYASNSRELAKMLR